MLPVCPATCKFARTAMSEWGPSRHWLYHAGFRAAVHTVLLVEERLAQEEARAQRRMQVHGQEGSRAQQQQQPGTACAPLLPAELWLLICTCLLRCHWPLALEAEFVPVSV